MRIFATLNAELQPVALTGSAAAVFWQRQEDGAYAANEAYVDASHVADWDAEALALNRVQAVDVAEPPSGKLYASPAFTLSVDAGGVITATAAYIDAPPPPRAQLPKSTVMARVFALGFAAQTKTFFDANFVAWSQWVTPDWPNVYVDDAGLLAALQAIGLTSEQIAQVTAV